MPLCSRCKKNVAVVFFTRMENGKAVNEGLCLKCAKELNIKPVTDLMDRMGISDDDLENLSEEMMNALGGMEGLIPQPEGDDSAVSGATGNSSVPFLDKMFGAMQNPNRNAPGGANQKEGGKEKDKEKDRKKKYLDAYATDLTARAREGKLDRIVGRDEEILRVIQILNRRQKNNPCLIGEPGVGKTAVAEALAQRVADGNVPYKLKDKEVHLLDLTALVAGTQFRGQFESRMKGLIEEIKKLGNIILVIDEVHNLVGAGEAEGSMNAANILKPALSRGEIQIIGATTFAEYRKHIEKDAALERRFQPVTVAEPSIEDSVEIIKGIRRYYEQYHGVTIDDEVARQAVLLSERYITDRFLPDKAIDLIDEACSSLNLKNTALERKETLDKDLSATKEEREALMSGDAANDPGVYQRLAYLKSHQLQLESELSGLTGKVTVALSVADLASVIELWTKIPASRICEQEFARLSGLPDRLKARVVGQDEAVEALSAGIRRSRVGISPKHKPASFIFVGPTGVGKTELVKCLAADLFDTPEALIRLDMSEYMEKHSVSKMIGSPPGYIGYDEAGQLTEKIRRRPYSVVLFDEIEKAHPDVLNILLQILDDGRITDAHGRPVNFENTILIMTSNAGSDRDGGTVGFGRSVTEQGREKALKALSDIMRPEFINRVDEIISFNHLSVDDFKEIAAILLSDLEKSLAERDIRLTYDETLVDYLVDKSFSVKYGARNLRRLIQKEVEDRIATLIIDHYETPLMGVHVSADGEKTVLASI